MGPKAVYSSRRRKPEPRYRALVEGVMKLDSGLCRNDTSGIMLRSPIFEHRLLDLPGVEFVRSNALPRKGLAVYDREMA